MTSLKEISWIWYGFVTLVMVARFASRILHMGSIKALQIDDWLMWVAFAAYTVDIVVLNIVAVTPTNLFAPGTDISTFTEADYALRIYGSKMTILVEQMQCIVVWTVKACLLIMYLRITAGRKERVWLVALSVYTAVTFVLMEVLYLGVWCRPITNYWAVPTPNIQCSAATNHLITNAVVNLSSDVLLLAIALPIFLRTQMAGRKKAAICIVFGLGIFTIIAAVLNKYYSFTNPFGSDWVEWYCHESSTNMMVANLPFVYTLLRRIFKLKSLDSSNRYASGSKFRSGKTTGKLATLLSRKGGNTVIDDAERGLKDQPVTVVTNFEIEEEKESLDGDKKQYEMDFLGSSAMTNHIVITGNSEAGPHANHLRLPPPASRRPSS
ncbi:hypothetical protein CAC42_392 [Sphaceloma murrayae]|uniref:Rhodopsin domain-containing protein n=1 Tax=Sphaceloma murrayae TaxID=2082308 RepID=A0A2K1R3C3_9PEZI|nr:hypothetical protein CAC42_392 [Sphaceloma murrayae]